MSDCIFCKIVTNVIPVKLLAENDSAILIADKNPMAPHHVLAIVKGHYDNVGELGSEDMSGILYNMFQLIDWYAIMNKLTNSGYRIIINSGKDAGQTVNHFHIHLLGGATLKNDFGA